LRLFLFPWTLLEEGVSATSYRATRNGDTQGPNSGYTFWTNNAHYNRLMALFNIVFDPDFRMNVVRDGLVDVLCQGEYKETNLLKCPSYVLQSIRKNLIN